MIWIICLCWYLPSIILPLLSPTHLFIPPHQLGQEHYSWSCLQLTVLYIHASTLGNLLRSSRILVTWLGVYIPCNLGILLINLNLLEEAFKIEFVQETNCVALFIPSASWWSVHVHAIGLLLLADLLVRVSNSCTWKKNLFLNVPCLLFALVLGIFFWPLTIQGSFFSLTMGYSYFKPNATATFDCILSFFPWALLLLLSLHV